jgi:muramoyltetrapeptide carboxypeptidase
MYSSDKTEREDYFKRRELPLIKPKRISKGSTIGIVSPSSGLWENSELWKGIDSLEERGYKVKLCKNAYEKTFYLAGSDEERASGMMDMFKDDSVDAVFNSMGGYGATRVWPYLDFDVIKKNPKIFMGYSDTTALLCAIYQKTGLVTFHGPDVCDMGIKSNQEYNFGCIEKTLSGEPSGIIEMAEDGKYLVKITGGAVSAPIVGGNLDLMCRTLGTPYEIDTRGKILVIEEVETEPWVVDAELIQMYNAGKLDDAVGFVIGECVDCMPKQINPGYHTERSVEDVMFDIIGRYDKPAILGLPIGHSGFNPVVPWGVMGTVDGTNGTFEITEEGVL